MSEKRGKLFEYVLLHHAPKKKDEERGRTHLLYGPMTIIARDEREVGIRAATEIPAAYLDKLDEVEILIRPF